MSYQDQFGNYLAKLEALEEVDIDCVLKLITPDFTFTDPFNRVTGRVGYEKVLLATLKDCLQMKFIVTKIIREKAVAFITWDFSFVPANKFLGSNRILVRGMSEIRISDSGLIAYHKDYWDVASTVYERIPLLGRILNRLRKRVAIKS